MCDGVFQFEKKYLVDSGHPNRTKYLTPYKVLFTRVLIRMKTKEEKRGI
jgi:hypothetical protein